MAAGSWATGFGRRGWSGWRDYGMKSERTPRRVVVGRLLMAWVLVVSLYFLWEADHYSGLYAWFAEWQFDLFGQYLPVLTYALLVIGFGWPAAWLLRARRRADRRELSGREAVVYTSSNFRRVLFAFAGGLAGAALVVLLWTLTLPRVAPPRQVVEVGSSLAGDPAEGPVILRGRIDYARTSALAEDLLVTTKGMRFAPMFGSSGDDGRQIRYFVELLPSDLGRPRTVPTRSVRAGVLVRNRLPGSIVRLYRYAGYTVEKPFYVLFASNASIRRPYIVTAVQLALAALIALVAALFQHRHVRRIGDRYQPVEPAQSDPQEPVA
ncbi:hypothetical protein SAMN05192583_3146 [Sphingomonas gellani]|uniref:Uncharacterized protein n=1 Tax=Sphingomonas gellani TaxID=1166340 RepID=A0A1H8HYI8_9SPHN|nr:hypothetical protein [Sphingomonas gellani]SEN61152.1 hypothetical protein SAMN05192583_3146 [Sphingomonas gellani]